MMTTDQELSVLKQVYITSLPDALDSIYDNFLLLDKLNASEDDWRPIIDETHQIFLSCQLFGLDLLCHMTLELEDMLNKPIGTFRLSQLRAIENKLLQMRDFAKVRQVTMH